MLPIKTYLYGGIALVIALLIIALKVQTGRLDAEKAAFSAFRAHVEALGQAAEKEAARANLANLKAKEQADRENANSKRNLAGVYESYRKLLAFQPGSGRLPEAAPGSKSPDLACFDRTAFNSGMAKADGVLQSGAIGILQRGDQAIIDLSSAKAWAKAAP